MTSVAVENAVKALASVDPYDWQAGIYDGQPVVRAADSHIADARDNAHAAFIASAPSIIRGLLEHIIFRDRQLLGIKQELREAESSAEYYENEWLAALDRVNNDVW